MKITVGIHENVVLQKVLINDKGRLVLYLRKTEEEEEEVNPMDQMNAAEVIEKNSDLGLIFWAPKTPDALNKDKTQRTEQERGEIANGDVAKLKNQFQQILEQFLTKDQIKWNIYEGTGLDNDNYYENISSQAVLDVIYRNICEQFIGMITPFLDKNEYAVRFKLARQNKEKHYPTVPGYFIKDNPFIELMTVPVKHTRVKWTAYELKEGLNDGTPVSRDTADQEDDIPEGENTFGSR